MLEGTRQTDCCLSAEIEEALVQARGALEAATESLFREPDGASDDLLAARLLIEAALVKLSMPHH